MAKFLGNFADLDTWPDQTLKQTTDGKFTYSLDPVGDFLMFYDADGYFEYSLQYSPEGGMMRFTKPNGITPDPLTAEQMAYAKG